MAGEVVEAFTMLIWHVSLQHIHIGHTLQALLNTPHNGIILALLNIASIRLNVACMRRAPMSNNCTYRTSASWKCALKAATEERRHSSWLPCLVHSMERKKSFICGRAKGNVRTQSASQVAFIKT